MAAALRYVLFWWVMLALPLQGIAATTMPLHRAESGASRVQDHAAADSTVGMGVLPSHERIAFCTGAPERPPRLRT